MRLRKFIYFLGLPVYFRFSYDILWTELLDMILRDLYD